MMDFPQFDYYESIELKTIKLRQQQLLDCRELVTRKGKFDSWQDHEHKRLVQRMETYLHALAEHRIQKHAEWPKTWWDAFKERWFPAWAKRRWPVEWSELIVDEPIYQGVCPHLLSDEPRMHLNWLATEGRKAVT